MFDLSRFADAMSSFLGQASQEALTGDVLQRIESLGIDLTALQGLEPGQIVEHLAGQGIDLSTLDTGQISEIAARLGEGGIGGQLAEWIASRGGRT